VRALLTLSLSAILVLIPVQEPKAQSFRCTDSKGVEYLIGARDNQKRECERARKNATAQATWGSANHSPRSFPLKITVNEQQSRDAERYKILQEELEVERKKLSAVAIRSKDGDFVSTEKSSALQRHQQNIAALQHELETMQVRNPMK
jgi:hypothetical protein